MSKRCYREMDEATKRKISRAMKGKRKTEKHKANISKGLIRYWASVPNKPMDNKNKEA